MKMDSLEYDILAALRMGSVPATGLDILSVGREMELSEILTQLEYVSEGKSALKFICGEFGVGKSFFCGLVRDLAFARGFAASSIVVSPDVPLARLDLIVGKSFDGLRLPEKRNACALSDLLERWLLRLVKKVASLEGLSVNDSNLAQAIGEKILAKIEEDLSTTRGLEPGFVNAVKSYMAARIRREYSLASDALGWLKGGMNLTQSRKNAIGVRGQLSPQASIQFMKGLLYMARDVDLKGIVWVIDEVETVQRLPIPRQRENSYESLRVLVDLVAENALPGLMLLITGTPKLFEDPRYGIPSYQPLRDRISQIALPDGQISLKQPLVTLKGFRFEHLLDLGKKVREIHARAYGWDAAERLPDQHAAKLAEMTVSGFGGMLERVPRVFLREIVHLCDLLHEHPSLSAEQYLTDEVVMSSRLSSPGSRYTESN
ncbi:ATP-binding protein [bacterium]|nr:ATP-binding protein [bacterium]